VTVKEEKDYLLIKDKLEKKKSCDQSDINNIIKHIAWNRQKFKSYVSYGDILKQVLIVFAGPMRQFVTCNFRNICCRKQSPEDYKALKRYEHGERRYFKAVDVVKILK
jgi:hypothetical protein